MLKIILNTINLENIPICNTIKEHENLCKQIIDQGGISKEQLKIGTTYFGICRNTNQAKWNSSKFEYERYKFGKYYIDIISHFQDEKYYDVFIPLKIITDENIL